MEPMNGKRIVKIVLAGGYLVGTLVLLTLYSGVEIRDHVYTFKGRAGMTQIMNVGIAVVVFSVLQVVSILFVLGNLLWVPDGTKWSWVAGIVVPQMVSFVPVFINDLVVTNCVYNGESTWGECLEIFSPLHFATWLCGIVLLVGMAGLMAVMIPLVLWCWLQELCCPQDQSAGPSPGPASGPASGPVSGPASGAVGVTVEMPPTVPRQTDPKADTDTGRVPLCAHLVDSADTHPV